METWREIQSMGAAATAMEDSLEMKWSGK